MYRPVWSFQISTWMIQWRVAFSSGAHVVWSRWKSQVYLSPYVEKPLNSKVIKCFVLELRSRKCFSCFGIPMFYVYMLCTFHISVSWALQRREKFRILVWHANLIRHLISTNQDDLSYSARTFISAHKIL